MTSQLQQVIQLTQSLSLSEQIELLKVLSAIVQQTYALETQSNSTENETEFSSESFQRSWQQAINGQILPLSQLWEEVESD